MNDSKHPRPNAFRISRHLKAALWSLPEAMSSKILLWCRWWTDVESRIQLTGINGPASAAIRAVSSFRMTTVWLGWGEKKSFFPLAICCFWVPFPSLLFAGISRLLLNPKVQLMGCRKRLAPGAGCLYNVPRHWDSQLHSRVPLSPANYRVNIPIRPACHIRRMRQLLSAPLIVMLDEMLNSNLVLTLSLTPVSTQTHTGTHT